MKKHAKFSASAAYRWLVCAGSVALCEKVPPEPDSPASIEGTLTHECLEVFLKNGEGKMLSTNRFLEGKHPTERVMRAESAAREIWKLRAKAKGAELLSETKSFLTHIHKEAYGTADAVIVEHFGTLYVIDYKNGKMPVDVEDNPQLIFYALGIAHSYDYNFEKVILVVIQPNGADGSKPVKQWETTIEHLRSWSLKFKAGIKAAERKNAELVSGGHCFFCQAKKICKAYRPENTKSERAKFIPAKSPEQRRKQLMLDFGQFADKGKGTTKKRAPRKPTVDDGAGF